MLAGWHKRLDQYLEVGVNSLFLPVLAVGTFLILFHPRVDEAIAREISDPLWRIYFKAIVLAVIIFVADALMTDCREEAHLARMC